MHSWPQEEASDSSDQNLLLLPFFQAQCLRQAFSQQTEVSVDILSSWQLCSLICCKLWRSMCPEISLSWWTFKICPTAALRSDVTARGMTQHRECESVMVYLSQVDVDGVLQELRSLSGPLLNGQHAHSFHTGFQLNDSCILILRHNKERCCGHCLLDTCSNQKEWLGGVLLKYIQAHHSLKKYSDRQMCMKDSPVAHFSDMPTHFTTEKHHTTHVCVLSHLSSTSLHFYPHCLLIKIQLIFEQPCAEM